MLVLTLFVMYRTESLLEYVITKWYVENALIFNYIVGFYITEKPTVRLISKY